MEIVKLDYDQVTRHRSKLVRFIRLYGDKRITGDAIRWLKGVTEQQLVEPGTEILVAVENRRIVGITAFARYGVDHSLAAVHPKFRKHGFAKEMVEKTLQNQGKIYARVALDNIPSIKTCFANGMIAFKLFTGPTGKPTLWFGGGNWSYEDVQEIK